MVEQIDPKMLHDHPLNSELYGDDVSDEFVESVRENGILTPLHVTEDYVVVSGHRRKKTAIILGMSEVPYIILKGVKAAADIERLLIVSNQHRIKTPEMIGREFKLLKPLIAARAKARSASNFRSAAEAAKELGVSETTARNAEKVVDAIDEAAKSGDKERAEELRAKLNSEGVASASRAAASKPELTEEQKRAVSCLNAYNVIANHQAWFVNNLDHRDRPAKFRELDQGMQKVFAVLQWIKKVT